MHSSTQASADWKNDRRRSTHAFEKVTLLVAIVMSTLVCVFAAGLIPPPNANLLTILCGVVWTAIGPHLVLLAALATVASGISLLRRRRVLTIVAATVSVAALVSSGLITARIIAAIDGAGGAANPFSALAISSMTTPPPDKTMTYTTVDGQRLQALVYEPAKPASSAPVLVYVHGGGWVVGGPDDTAADLRWYADQGMVVMSVSYRLATKQRPTWNEAPQDVACALSWVSSHAAALGGDPARIAVFGESAGGNLAINLAYSAAEGTASSGCGGRVPVPAAVIAEYPVVDPMNAVAQSFPVAGSTPADFTSTYVGGTPADRPDRMRAISSATYLSDRAPHTLVIEPEDDPLIPPEAVYRFVSRARSAGVNVVLHTIPFASHGFDINGLVPIPAAGSLGNQSRTIVLHYLHERHFV